MTPPAYLTVKEVAVRWGVSKRTVRRLVHEGQLEAGQRGHAYLISKAQVAAFEQQRQASLVDEA